LAIYLGGPDFGVLEGCHEQSQSHSGPMAFTAVKRSTLALAEMFQ